ncbi:hypothetical protein V7S82_24210, partial [Enterobacter hormaechei subsp. steigerwaltii]|uniref:hypothetical protein n=1 Tax=Enterobacter hormaechei TaxID=158836 RepID=UPI003204A995
KKNPVICKFSDIKKMDKDSMSSSAKDQKMPKLSSQILQKQGKKVRRKTPLAGEDRRAMAWILGKKKNKIFTTLKAIERHGMLSSAGTCSKDCPFDSH